MLLIDSGLRNAEARALTWGDVSLKSGVVRIGRGKGGKSRSVVIGAKTRRTLLAYRRKVSHRDEDPLIQTVSGTHFSGPGLRSLLLRISERCGFRVTPHALRRTFATLSLRAGMSPLHLQGLLGHSTLEMVRRYAELIDEDLVKAHKEHGPIDHWLRN